MKKSLSLLAIMGLLLSIGLVSFASASAPVYPELPGIKLFTLTQGLTPAFDLAWFNTVDQYPTGPDQATAYSNPTSFLNQSSIETVASSFSGFKSVVDQGSYFASTAGSNVYTMTNAGGSVNASNKVKYATYKIYELPRIILGVGQSKTINVASYTYSSTGVVGTPPASFGQAAALVSSDPTKVTAVWSGNTAVTVSMITASPSAAIEVDVTAAPIASAPYGTNIDKEKILVYSNLLSNSAFTTASDTNSYITQLQGGTSTPAGTYAVVTDSQGTAQGAYVFTFADSASGVKGTYASASVANNSLSISSGKWYTMRADVVSPDASNTHQAVLVAYNGALAAGIVTDLGANFQFGIPNAWTTLETNFIAHNSSSNGYPQFQLKPGGATGSAAISNIRFAQATPTLFEAARGNTRNFYAGGNFSASNSTSYWGHQVYSGAASEPSVALVNSQLAFTLSGSGTQGTKWTASTTNGVDVVTPSVTVNGSREAGARVNFNIGSGSFNSLSDIIVALALGASSNGSITIGGAGTNLFGAAEIGAFVGGDLRSASVAAASGGTAFYQLQFGLRAAEAGTINIAGVDFDSDNNDPNKGDVSLFP